MVANRANGRWKTILDAQANFFGQQATISMIGISVDKKAEEEEAKASGDDLSSDNDAASGALNGDNNMSVSDLYKKGKDTVNNVKSGNYGDALNAIGSTTGDMGAGKVGDYIGRAGNAYNAGEKTADQLKSGNYGAAAGEALGGFSDTVGDKIDGKAGDIIKGTASGLGSADAAVDALKNKQWKNAWQNIEGGYHNYENASGRNGEKEEDAKPRETPTQKTSTPANNGIDYSQWNYGNSQNQNENKTNKDNEWHAPLAPKDNDSNSKSNSGSKPSWADYGSFAGGSSGYGGNTSNNSNNNWVSPLLPSQQTGSNN